MELEDAVFEQRKVSAVSVKFPFIDDGERLDQVAHGLALVGGEAFGAGQ